LAVVVTAFVGKDILIFSVFTLGTRGNSDICQELDLANKSQDDIRYPLVYTHVIAWLDRAIQALCQNMGYSE
jgi:hypothetical protein